MIQEQEFYDYEARKTEILRGKLRSLLVMGWTKEGIAKACRFDVRVLYRLAHGERIRIDVANRLEYFYDKALLGQIRNES